MAVVNQADGSARLSWTSSSVETATAQGHDELSRSSSFWTPAESPSSSPPSSLNSSRDSIAAAPGDPDRRSSSSSSTSTSFYESFHEHDRSSSFDDFETLPPAAQTMTAAAKGKQAEYDSKRLPSSMFRREQPTTCPAEWSAASNESLFSIQLENSGDLYYDAAGVFHRLPSASGARMAAVPESTPPGSSGVVVPNKKSVRFAASEEVTEARAAAAEVTEGGWCFWPSATWWPSCCACRGCGCRGSS